MATRNKYGLQDLPDASKELDQCLNFLQNSNNYSYTDQLQEISNRERKIFVIEVDDLKNHFADSGFIENLEKNTARYVRHFEEAIDQLLPPPNINIGMHEDVFDILLNQRLSSLRKAGDNAIGAELTPNTLLRRYEVSIIPSAEWKTQKLREIKADDIGHLVKIRGLVTRTTDVKPQIVVGTYTCEVCGCEIYSEVSGNQFMPIIRCPSQRCKDNKTIGKPVLQTRGSKFIKYQEVKLQELPDQVPVGHIPRTLTVHCTGEQTRLCGPGNVVTVSGVFLTVKYVGFRAIKAGLYTDTFLHAYHIEKEKLGYQELLGIDKETEDIVRELSRDIDPYSRLASSIAPEIYGHDDVKKALLLQLVGGVTKNLSDGMKIRGDVNICLMGDPGVAKSQLLRYIASIAPRGVYTTGKGSSGVGLTAAMVRDQVTGDFALEGGALVLADMGVCCIDEFDKMDEYDRTAIHEVMEQQTISIAKAGITTTLNARASVLAAANPLYGRYNIKKSISDNVDLPNSLLSRFDLLFLILDKPDLEKDSALSNHVLHVHRHMKNPNENNGRAVTPKAFKQYIAVAKRINPIVPKDLSSHIVEAYVNLRQQETRSHTGRSHQGMSTDQAVMTPRQLLSILRLSQALARLRLSNTVSMEDVKEAIRLTHASKASLNDEMTMDHSKHHDDVLSTIYSIIRDYAMQNSMKRVEYVHVESMIVKKGFNVTHLTRCLDEYQSLGVWTIDNDANYITFIDGSS